MLFASRMFTPRSDTNFVTAMLKKKIVENPGVRRVRAGRECQITFEVKSLVIGPDPSLFQQQQQRQSEKLCSG